MENVQNPAERMFILQNRISDNLIMQKTVRREGRANEADYLHKLFGKMSDSHEYQSELHLYGLIGGAITVLGAASGEAGIKALGKFFSQCTEVPKKMSEGDLSRIQGCLEELRNLLAEDTKREDEIKRLIHEIAQMLDAAIERSNRSKTAVFSP